MVLQPHFFDRPDDPFFSPITSASFLFNSLRRFWKYSLLQASLWGFFPSEPPWYRGEAPFPDQRYLFPTEIFFLVSVRPSADSTEQRVIPPFWFPSFPVFPPKESHALLPVRLYLRESYPTISEAPWFCLRFSSMSGDSDSA